MFATGTLVAFASVLIAIFFGLEIGLPLLVLAAVFLLIGRRKGTLFQWDRFFPATHFYRKEGIAYRDLTGAVITAGRVIFVLKDGQQTSIPISAGTAAVLSHLLRVGVRVEYKLADAQWHQAQKSMALWDWLDRSAVFRTHAWLSFILGVPAFGVYISMLSARGATVSNTAWMENALFLGIVIGLASVALWTCVILVYQFMHGRPGEATPAIEKSVRATDLWSGVLTAAVMAIAIGWFHIQEQSAARRGFEQPQTIAEVFGRTANRAPASRR